MFDVTSLQIYLWGTVSTRCQNDRCRIDVAIARQGAAQQARRQRLVRGALQGAAQQAHRGFDPGAHLVYALRRIVHHLARIALDNCEQPVFR